MSRLFCILVPCFLRVFRVSNIFSLFNYWYNQSHRIMIASLDAEYGAVCVRSVNVMKR